MTRFWSTAHKESRGMAPGPFSLFDVPTARATGFSGYDWDESPLAVFKESESASVRYVEIGHNRSPGQYIGRQLRGLNPGDVVRINVK